jgi:hypothetical protein
MWELFLISCVCWCVLFELTNKNLLKLANNFIIFEFIFIQKHPNVFKCAKLISVTKTYNNKNVANDIFQVAIRKINPAHYWWVDNIWINFLVFFSNSPNTNSKTVRNSNFKNLTIFNLDLTKLEILNLTNLKILNFTYQ